MFISSRNAQKAFGKGGVEVVCNLGSDIADLEAVNKRTVTTQKAKVRPEQRRNVEKPEK